MIGVIYKFSVLGGYKYFQHHPFYIGQHYCESISVFLNKNDSYYGSGKKWLEIISDLRIRYPKNWRCLIRREVLYAKEGISQKALDVLEEHFIKKEKSHYSYRLGGCNILWGTANNWGAGSPMKDPDVAKRVTEKLRGRRGAKRSDVGRMNMKIAAKKSWEGKSGEVRRKRMSEAMKLYCSQPWVRVQRSLMHKGRVFTEEHRKHISEHHADFSGEKHPRYGVRFHWINNGIVSKCLPIGCDLPNGWQYGVVIKK